ncbi:transketolase [Rhodospirillaceae bacterium KN72]|uniref:Transketolase n=1 Tax=Pacificispira spongiicola TaxID=2729598 RepID=A0A7Y0HEH6_9PROT|nr:transketolase [Pacificispira spongiicola]NMM42952.1 transketolase [Pacificispira spongiicola]
MPTAFPAKADLTRMANAIRALAMDSVERAKSGHPGMPMGMADVATVLFSKFLKFDPKAPNWPDRDRFILSAGHGSMLIYSLLHLTGYEDMSMEDLKNFRQLGSKTAGHPEFGHASGIETTTGPLGQGIANAVGFALAERLTAARYGDDLIDHHTYVIAGDGCLMEGISHEAISLAGHLKLGKLIVLWDDNGISIDGPTSLSVSDDQLKRFEASGWDVRAVDGHDMDAIEAAIAAAKATDTPSLIACKTTIGFGAPKKAGTSGSHGAPLGAEEIEGARKALDWPYAPYEIPADVRENWTAVGAQGAALRAAWEAKLAASGKADDFTRAMSGGLPGGWQAALDGHIEKLLSEKPSLATRVASQKALEVLTEAIPELIGGSADLTGSNNTKTPATAPISADDFSGRYVYYGVREHGMAAAMNGMALHGGVVPYGGTFLVFTDYCRPSIRLSALMGQRVVYVMTHDSIGLGEDGPTHQPVEHMAALRAIPNLLVFRPCDAVETAECWAAALASEDAPSVLALTRQNLPVLRTGAEGKMASAKGGYVLREAEAGPRAVTLIATGSEVEIAVAARETLEAGGVGTAVVSMPCFELFARQSAEYRDAVLGRDTVRIGVEAAIRQGWDSVLGCNGDFVGMTGFGASGPYKDLYEHFGITASAVVDAAKARL